MEDEVGGENSFCLFLLANQRQILFGNTKLKWENFGKTKFIPFLKEVSQSSSPGQDQYGDHLINKCRPRGKQHYGTSFSLRRNQKPLPMPQGSRLLSILN
jgi:hypothetical protein